MSLLAVIVADAEYGPLNQLLLHLALAWNGLVGPVIGAPFVWFRDIFATFLWFL
jgi:hypothetical protein